MSSTYLASTERIREIAEIVVGILLCIMPIALWVAWSTHVFYLVLIVGAVGVIVFGLLIFSRPDQTQPLSNSSDKVVLDDKAIAEHHKLYPMIHQNTAQSRKVMAALKASQQEKKTDS